MHRRTFLSISLLLVVFVGSWGIIQLGSRDHSKTRFDPRSDANTVIVVVAEVRQQDTPVYLEGLGKVQALNTVTVRSQVDGKIIQMTIREGAEVKPGDPLAQIDPRSYEAALNQVLAKREQDRTQLAYADKVLARDAGLFKQGIIDQQTFDLQQATFAQLEALIKADEAAIGSARVQLEYTHITAPIEGRVGLRRVDSGNVVRANDTAGLADITQMRPISIVFTFPEGNLRQIQRGRKATAEDQPLVVLALDRNNNQVIERGVLEAIDNQIDEVNGTIKLKATFANPEEILWPGQFVNVRLLVSHDKDGLVIPANAIQQGPEGTYVYVINENRIASLRPIKIASTQGGVSLVESGVKVGEKVVVDGQAFLQPNSHVEIQAPTL